MPPRYPLQRGSEGASVLVGLQKEIAQGCTHMIGFKFAVVIAIAFGIGVITWRISLLIPAHALAVTFLLMGLGGVGVSKLLERL
jgi:hypothetical protein